MSISKSDKKWNWSIKRISLELAITHHKTKQNSINQPIWPSAQMIPNAHPLEWPSNDESHRHDHTGHHDHTGRLCRAAAWMGRLSKGATNVGHRRPVTGQHPGNLFGWFKHLNVDRICAEPLICWWMRSRKPAGMYKSPLKNYFWTCWPD